MAAPVWVLSVDLQTKTASFATGMADAAKSARSAFADIKASAKEGGEAVGKSAINAQQALGVLTNALRGDTENAFADIIRELSHTSVVMAALPFAAAAGGALLLVNVVTEVAAKIKEWRESQEKLTAEQTRFGTAVNESFGQLDDRILQAQQRADELRNNHLGALQKQLELINHASMQDLIHEFENISKAAEGTFKLLEGNWYTFGAGSGGAQHALEQFKEKYESLLSAGKGDEAADLLKGTRESAERVLQAQQLIQSGATRSGGGLLGPSVDYTAQYRALAVMQAAKVTAADKDIQSQKALLDVLDKQMSAQERIAELKKLEGDNDRKAVSNAASSQHSAASRESAQAQLAIQQQLLAADKAYADARLVMQQATAEQRLQSDIAFAERDKSLKLAANEAEIAALDRSGNDYNNQLKALRDAALVIDAQHDAAVAALRSKADVEQYQRDLANLQQSEREKINATQQGSAERLAAIDAAIKEAEARSLQETDYYRSLSSQRIDFMRQAAQDEAKLKADAGREAADNALKMGQLEVEAEREQMELSNSSRRVTAQQRMADQMALAEIEYQLKRQALQDQATALDASAKDYENKLRAIQNREQQLSKEHENEMTRIADQGTKERNQRVLEGYSRFSQSIAQATASVLMGQRTFAQTMNSLGSQIVGGMIQNAVLSAMALDFTKEKEAAAAARAAFTSTMQYLPFPANIVTAPIAGAGAFASVMAFAQGGTVPGTGNFDSVHAVLTPGEYVMDKKLTENLRRAANNDTAGGGGQTVHFHINPTYHNQSLDQKGLARTLRNNTSTLTKHFRNEVRKLNK